MPHCHLDFETRSECELKKTNSRIYADDPTTEVILLCWAVDDGPVHTWCPLTAPDGSDLPVDLLDILEDPKMIIVAHNATFEQDIMSGRYLKERHGFPDIPLDRWEDTMAMACRMALPRSLGDVAKALDLPIKKDAEGAKLMLKMCKPRRNRKPGTPMYHETPDEIERLAEYCRTDVETERLIYATLRVLPPKEMAIWRATTEINQRGFFIDVEFAEAAQKVAYQKKLLLDKEMAWVTDGEVRASSQVYNLRKWCQKQGVFVPDDDLMDDDAVSLDKNAITEKLDDPTLPEQVRLALEIRLAAGKSSVAKYTAMLNRVGPDGRVREGLVYHGAAPGRWAGSGVQPQNFPRKTVEQWEDHKENILDVANGRTDIEELETFLGMDVMTTLSRMLRGTITVPNADTQQLGFADYSQIEARGVAWLAGCKTLTDLFASGGAVYEEMASVIYRMPTAKVGRDSKERFTGKTAVLGCGYGMGWKKFGKTCAMMGVEVSPEEARTAVDAYRTQYHEIPTLWREMERAMKSAINVPYKEFFICQGAANTAVRFFYDQGKRLLMMRLPSGRSIYYHNPSVREVETDYGTKSVIYYWTVNSVTRKWQETPIWGGHIVENAVQGLCRDIMANAILRARDHWPHIAPVLTVHDELVVEGDRQFELGGLLNFCMLDTPDWTEGLPIACDVKTAERYGK